MATNNLWTRDEMILVLNLYLKIPFGKMHKGNPNVIKMAHLIGRTPDAVAYRLVNYASYDPQLKQRGISGMSHGGKKCEEYWNEFVDDREKLLYESERILAQYEGTSIEKKYKKELKAVITTTKQNDTQFVNSIITKYLKDYNVKVKPKEFANTFAAFESTTDSSKAKK